MNDNSSDGEKGDSNHITIGIEVIQIAGVMAVNMMLIAMYEVMQTGIPQRK